MTAQASDKLRNDNPRVDFGDLHCYGLIRSHPKDAHPWDGVLGDIFDYPRPPRQQADSYCTGLYRGYIASHVLNNDGTLTLAAYEYMGFDQTEEGNTSLRFDEDPVDQPIAGDFWLILRPHFYTDPTTFVPFRDGHIVEDRSQWITLSVSDEAT